MNPRFAIIVAGGTGTRMGSSVPKQFLQLGHQPVIFYTLDAFRKALPDINLIVVLHPDFLEMWNALILQHQFVFDGLLVKGGVTRFKSVQEGLRHVPSGVVLAIHDAVRPLVSPELIRNAFQLVEPGVGVLPCVPLKDSIREVKGQWSLAVNRNHYRLVQTPQIFYGDALKDAYEFASVLDADGEGFTDDASVFERAGGKMKLIEGETCNIKITTPEDLQFAKAFIFGT